MSYDGLLSNTSFTKLLVHLLSTITDQMRDIVCVGTTFHVAFYSKSLVALLDNAYVKTLSAHVANAPQGDLWSLGLANYGNVVSESLDTLMTGDAVLQPYWKEIRAKFKQISGSQDPRIVGNGPLSPPASSLTFPRP